MPKEIAGVAREESQNKRGTGKLEASAAPLAKSLIGVSVVHRTKSNLHLNVKGYPPRRVYLVTRGCYSDYSVVGAFTTRAKAQKFLDTYALALGSDARIEDYALNLKLPARDMWEITITPDGAKRYVRNVSQAFKNEDSGCYLLDVLQSPPSWTVRDVKPGVPAGCGMTDKSFTVTCFPRDEEHGLKIARDAMRGVIAHGLWKHDATGPLA